MVSLVAKHMHQVSELWNENPQVNHAYKKADVLAASILNLIYVTFQKLGNVNNSIVLYICKV